MIALIVRVLCWMLLLTPLSVRAAPPLVLLSDAGSSYADMLAALQRHYDGPLESQVLANAAPAGDERLFLAVGSRACALALDHLGSRGRLFCLFLPAQTFAELTADAHSQTLLADQRLSALFLDQPLARQMRLARLIEPDLQRIGTVLGPDSDAQARAFEQSAREQGLTPVIGRLRSSDNPVQVLSPIIADSDLFLPLPDRSVFNRAAAKWILYITLRKGVPLLGFSAKYADAGAVVALYSDTDEIARQAAEMLTAMDGQLPPPAWPREFSITVNRTAARNLDLVLPPAERLVEQLKAQEAP
jgi:hypothetical protein